MNNAPSPKKKWALTEEAFERLLAWLDSDCVEAGRKYKEIQLNLIKNFTRLGCELPEALADKTIDRVAKKLPEIEATYVGNPANYFYAVAYNIYREDLRTPKTVPLPSIDILAPDPPVDEQEGDVEPTLSCLRRSISHLNQRDQDVIRHYYKGEKQIKIRLRKELAQRLGISLPALRLLAQRARKKLKKLILACLKERWPNTGLNISY